MLTRLLPHVRRLRAAGLALLAAGLALALAWDPAVGLALVVLAGALLAVSHPLLALRARSRAGRRAAPMNGHPGPPLPEDVDPT